jgi:general stress protein 26
MTTKTELKTKFWKALKSDRTAMLGLVDVEDGHAQPMTALLDPDRGEKGPIYFFTAKDNGLVQAMKLRAMKQSHRAMLHFASKGHDLFAAVHGTLVLDDDRATIDRLWNPFIAAWFEGGKDDPKLQLIRLDAESAEIWLNENSLFAGVKMLLGSDPKHDYKDKVAEVSLR